MLEPIEALLEGKGTICNRPVTSALHFAARKRTIYFVQEKEGTMLPPEPNRGSEFQRLRDAVHQEMEQAINARLDAGYKRPTDLELELDAFEEEIEPQVLNAVKIFNAKGYTTVSSGFYGVDCEDQCIDGPFSVDRNTIQKLAAIGVRVEPYPRTYGVPGSMVKFSPDEPDLEKIKAKWDHIAALLPDRRDRRKNTQPS